MTKEFKAAMIVIGNEVLSGRTQDKNINYVAKKMVSCGVRLAEVRIIPDVKETIIDTVRTLSDRFDYVFTSGGIGPTHDDITAESVAKTFDIPLEQNSDAYDILLAHYGEEELTEARLKMAQIPVGGSLIFNPVSAAPGFQIKNVYVMAGVPRIMQAMLDNVAGVIQGGTKLQSRTIPCPLPESVVAPGLGEIQTVYPDIDIGSYPHFGDKSYSVQVVLRGVNETELDNAERDVLSLIKKLL